MNFWQAKDNERLDEKSKKLALELDKDNVRPRSDSTVGTIRYQRDKDVAHNLHNEINKDAKAAAVKNSMPAAVPPARMAVQAPKSPAEIKREQEAKDHALALELQENEKSEMLAQQLHQEEMKAAKAKAEREKADEALARKMAEEWNK